MKKRFLSGLLLLVMLFSLAPVKVYAAEAPPDISTPDGTPKADDTEPPAQIWKQLVGSQVYPQRIYRDGSG